MWTSAAAAGNVVDQRHDRLDALGGYPVDRVPVHVGAVDVGGVGRQDRVIPLLVVGDAGTRREVPVHRVVVTDLRVRVHGLHRLHVGQGVAGVGRRGVRVRRGCRSPRSRTPRCRSPTATPLAGCRGLGDPGRGVGRGVRAVVDRDELLAVRDRVDLARVLGEVNRIGGALVGVGLPQVPVGVGTAGIPDEPGAGRRQAAGDGRVGEVGVPGGGVDAQRVERAVQRGAARALRSARRTTGPERDSTCRCSRRRSRTSWTGPGSAPRRRSRRGWRSRRTRSASRSRCRASPATIVWPAPNVQLTVQVWIV